MRFEPFFLDMPDGSGRRFCVHHPARTAKARGSVLFVHPFAEEMNKSRRMVARQARALAEQGFNVLLIDLLGCGDSDGDFGDATWDAWLADIRHGAAWLRANEAGPLWLWGLRAGCLLASEAAAGMAPCAGWLLWQPATNGRVLAQQFLRLRLASGMLGGRTATAASLREELQAAGSIDVAGYTVSAGLLSGLENARLAAPPANTAVHWIEVDARTTEPALLPASAQLVQQWQSAGVAVHAQAVAGPAFWQVTEIEDAPALIGVTGPCLQQAAMPA